MDLAAVPAASHAGWSRFTSYAKTLQGGLILLEMLLCLSVAACCLWSYYIGYVACPLIEVIFAGIFYWVYMNGYDREASALNWSWTDIFRCVSAAVILLVISLINLSRRHVGNVLGGLFGLTAITVFLYNVYLLYPKCHAQTSLTDDPPAYTP
ncbi:proteolipid protein 2-like isoform X2 [Carcharodon carcharias]|uniref:proteolipid protein 2-like isoform X2 n=1 Tax=Carcharodon carcharias TaxID=13397 RepID=UPI001B7E407B|nr:proteolipid protein 2-like isoform X2 [Carcharodon carcharias]